MNTANVERWDFEVPEGISINDLMVIAGHDTYPALSLYLPAFPSRTHIQADRIRMKNALKSAEQQLQDAGSPSQEVASLLEIPRRVLGDAAFWSHQSNGLVFFLSSEFKRGFRLPFAVPELTIVANAFYLKPLLPMLRGESQFYVLALTQKGARLMQADRGGINEVPLPELPPNRDEALGFSFEHQDTVQWGGRARAQNARFFAHADMEQSINKVRVQQYFHLVDQAVHGRLRDKDLPLVLAGVDYLFPMYREANSYQRLVDGGISGNPDQMTLRELHERGLKLVQPFFEEQEQRAIEKFSELGDRSKTSLAIHEIAIAACRGQIETLFVVSSMERWGKVDLNLNAVDVHGQREPGDRDLIDLCAVHTFINGGVIYSLPSERMPGRREAAAIFRYPYHEGVQLA